MIGLGPHEMSVWLWAFSAGLTVLFALLTGLSVFIAVKLTSVSGDGRAIRD